MIIKSDEPFSIWIIGPTSSGKSTITRKLYEIIKVKYPNLIIIDGGNIRDLFDNKYGYDKVSRSRLTKRYIKLVKWLQSYRISSLVSVISPFEKDRILSKESLTNYNQIYLKCSLENRILRDKINLYKPALAGLKKNVIDVDIPFEQSKINDLVIDTDIDNVSESVDKIIKKIF